MFVKNAIVNILHMLEKEEKSMITMEGDMADIFKRIEILEMITTLSEMKNTEYGGWD